MKNLLYLATFAAMLTACSPDDPTPPISQAPIITPAETFVRAADISYLPQIESSGTLLYNNGIAEDMLTTLKNSGCNTIRLRLWKDPADAHSGMAEVSALTQRARVAGLKVWLTVHYSDTWADPGHQAVPAAWQALSFDGLKSAVSAYTSEIITAIHPDIFQIGNETNDGFLWPMGKMSTNETQSLQLFSAAAAAVRTASPGTKIMLHFAGITSADWFFGKVHNIDYDYIGLSYYPVWHGKDLNLLSSTINSLGVTHTKKVLIAETAYPFTLQWADGTNNIVGLENQLIPSYPATPEGQKSFVLAIKAMVKASPSGQGFSYWGGEWIAFHGSTATDGSTFENQALYNFDHQALPVMQAFSAE